MKIKSMLVITVLALLSSQVQAKDILKLTYNFGSELLTNCEGEDSFSQGLCFGYIEGAYDSYAVMVKWGIIEKDFICVPVNVSKGQLVKVVVKYLNDNPAELHLIASSRVIHALSAAFPCE